jgi:uncharacterized membrane protein YphA (DoxX/SURF4 family)
MNTIAIYSMQATMGVLAVAAGAAKLAGADVMVDAFDMLGLGASIRMTAGMVEVIGGLCLLLPRAGVAGALMLAAVMIGSAGLAVGHIASGVISASAATGPVRMHPAVGRADQFTFQQPASVRGGIDI